MNRYTDALKEYTILLSEQANLYTTLKGLRESIERQIENGCSLYFYCNNLYTLDEYRVLCRNLERGIADMDERIKKLSKIVIHKTDQKKTGLNSKAA